MLWAINQTPFSTWSLLLPSCTTLNKLSSPLCSSFISSHGVQSGTYSPRLDRGNYLRQCTSARGKGYTQKTMDINKQTKPQNNNNNKTGTKIFVRLSTAAYLPSTFPSLWTVFCGFLSHLSFWTPSMMFLTHCVMILLLSLWRLSVGKSTWYSNRRSWLWPQHTHTSLRVAASGCIHL